MASFKQWAAKKAPRSTLIVPAHAAMHPDKQREREQGRKRVEEVLSKIGRRLESLKPESNETDDVARELEVAGDACEEAGNKATAVVVRRVADILRSETPEAAKRYWRQAGL